MIKKHLEHRQRAKLSILALLKNRRLCRIAAANRTVQDVIAEKRPRRLVGISVAKEQVEDIEQRACRPVVVPQRIDIADLIAGANVGFELRSAEPINCLLWVADKNDVPGTVFPLKEQLTEGRILDRKSVV